MLTWTGRSAEKQIKELKNIRKITIATAFLSWYGLDLLKELVSDHKLKPDDVTLYLSTNFSDNDPVGLLQALRSISNTYIVVRSKLHAKAFLFEGKVNLLVTGSSNLTKGGFVDNLELNTVSESPDIERLRLFFGACHNLAISVDDSVLDTYRATEDERKTARRAQSAFHDKLQLHLTNDAFPESKYPGIERQYFTYRDYETLFAKNQERKDSDIDRRRKELQKKMLGIDALVGKAMGELGLVHHWRPENITSTIVPGDFNRNRVAWCGVRYTRKKTAEYIRELRLSEDGHGFPKFACLQYCLTSSGFEINLFHAVRHEAVDRDYVVRQLENKSFCAKVIKEIGLLQGHSFYWYAGDANFSFDDKDPEDFVAWYKANDRDGAESYLAFQFDPDSPELASKETIAPVFIEYAKLLLPLFHLLSYSWGA